MVLSVLVFVLGFCCAALFALLLVPYVWRRAVRLTRKRLEDGLPLSLNDIRADRDELRAEVAVSQRKLEQKVEKALESEASVRAENGKHLAKIDSMTFAIAERDGRIEDFEAMTDDQSGRIVELESNLEETVAALADARVRITGLTEQVANLDTNLSESHSQIDSQRVEIVALKTQSDNLSDLLSEKSDDYKALEQRFDDAQAARRTGTARIASLERSLEIKERETARSAERLTRIEADHAATVERLRREAEKASAEIRDLQSRITIQAAESLRQGKRSTSLEDQFSAAATELARMESLLHETERRATTEIERAREILERERARRRELARELADARGTAFVDPTLNDHATIPPFAAAHRKSDAARAGRVAALTSGVVHGRQSPVSRVRISTPAPETTSRVIKPAPHPQAAPAAHDTANGLAAHAANGASNGTPNGASNGSIADRVARLRTELSDRGECPAVANGANGTHETIEARKSAGLGAMSNSELQARIRDLADRFAVFNSDTAPVKGRVMSSSVPATDTRTDAAPKESAEL
ncbi:MAG: hypothetical protein KDJ77_20380 [Rhodobiaceae bacterium]|nr:hypothetical protein [Rhodobiaceae bacterium]